MTPDLPPLPSDIAAIRDALAAYEAWQAHNAANISEWLTTEQLRAECSRLSESGAPSPELLLAHAMRALESAQKDAERYRWLRSKPLDWRIEHHRNGWATNYGRGELDAAIDAAMKEAP